MPQFTVEVLQALEEKGVDHAAAEADLRSAIEVPGLDIGVRTVLMTGRLCVYLCREQSIFGRRDLVVVGVWFHETQ